MLDERQTVQTLTRRLIWIYTVCSDLSTLLYIGIYLRVYVFIYYILWVIKCSLISDCPVTWVSFQQKCYYFSYYPELNYNSALSACNVGTSFIQSREYAPNHMFTKCMLCLKWSTIETEYFGVKITKTRLFKYIENFTFKN